VFSAPAKNIINTKAYC